MNDDEACFREVLARAFDEASQRHAARALMRTNEVENSNGAIGISRTPEAVLSARNAVLFSDLADIVRGEDAA